ncbi:RNA polymerase sigma factor [Burkholderia alba]|uniref:RNA polymerase sigma factor n=1 Tax=Burkholderia alba TaxID=2683677 RepID=UPI002B061CDE|nr:RNA polymerase sigma factor [Burkholderia alba]
MGEHDREVGSDDPRGATGDAAVRSLRFQQLALPHLDAAYNLARWLCGNASDAEDIVQEACMRAFRFFDSFHGDSARAWLLTIVRHTWYTEWRRRATAHEMAALDDFDTDAQPDGWSSIGIDPQALLIREEDARLVHDALGRLPAEYREVLVLREMEELSYREIAAIADLPVGTVMSRLARGRRRLAEVLTAQQGGRGASRPAAGGAAARPVGDPAADCAPSGGRRARPSGAAGGSEPEAVDGL